MLEDLLDFLKDCLKVICIILALILFVLALPKMVEQATTDTAEQPYSGATPDCPRHIDEYWTPSN